MDIYTLKNQNGLEARITNYGGIVMSLTTPDRRGHLADVVLGYETVEDYVRDNPYFGCLVGRCGNRVARGQFALGGKTYRLAINNEPNHLHGGVKGFDKVVWEARPHETATGPALELKHLSEDGDEGYPGNLSVTAVYTLTEDDALQLDYTATTDQDTIVNLTHHSYFNLAGAGRGDVLDHEVTLDADRFTPVDETLIPTGELRSVENTPLDFRTPHRIGERIGDDDEQLRIARGYDHNWVLNKPLGQLGRAARVYEPDSRRVMEVFTTAPGMQFYTANFLDGSQVGKGGVAYGPRTGFCMEPQHYPDSPNKPKFPAVVLRPGDSYRHTIVYRFSTCG